VREGSELVSERASAGGRGGGVRASKPASEGGNGTRKGGGEGGKRASERARRGEEGASEEGTVWGRHIKSR